MLQIVREGHPDRVLLGLLNPDIALDFISTSTDEDFADALCSLDPEYFIVPFRDLHYHLSPTLETRPQFRYVKSFEERTTTFINILNKLTEERINAVRAIPLRVHCHLLKCHAACGRADLAKHVFYKSMPEDQLMPDRACYNYLMEALTWNNAYSGRERYKLRVTGDRLAFRSYDDRPLNLAGHGVASPSNPENKDSIRIQVLKIFNDLVRQGISGDEATFCHLMIAMGREGDMEGVKSILKSVWNIDIDGLNAYDEEELESPTFYVENSILRPSERLLFTIAHIFGSNNQIDTASTLLDYVSRHYNMEISSKVWNHLLGWAYSLFSQGRPWQRRRGLNIGRPSAAAVESLFAVLQGEPYNIQFGIVPLHYRIRVRLAKRVLDPLLSDVRDCLRQLDDDRLQLSTLYDKLRVLVLDNYGDTHQGDLATVGFLNLRREFILTALRTEAHLQMMIVNLRNMFKENHFAGGGKEVEYSWRRLPKLILEFPDFLPNIVPYYTPTGHVMLILKETRKQAILETNTWQMTRTSSLRNMLDTFSPFKLMHATWVLSEGSNELICRYFDSLNDPSAENVTVDWVAKDEFNTRKWRLNEPSYRDPYPPSADRPESGWSPWPGPPPPRGSQIRY
ncbi:uncharacterized protein A1O9_11035 [Exophiala aquamarina CBS 119918]|uniref:Uncharacterized protein n=1 Tax=Exophiala aquamarina CBS 119918 TaxID=1182545 RepID=A0A072P0B9_9EURO|nr:uncharacterized protein A1O9_11035 [Exophiala aquamarina CBS 119918]KEF53127.1 hypothetical protein A1O9_11035 [Exophiala aquamarina CBS 119918]